MLGIEKLKAFFLLVIAFQKQAVQSFGDGFQPLDLFSFFDEAMQVKPTIIDSKDEIIAEIDDLDHTERQQLRDFLVNELQIPDDQVEEFIAESADWAVATYKVIRRGREIFGKE